MACSFCNSAFVDPELSFDNDLSFIGVGSSDDSYSMFIRSGDGRPVALFVNHIDDGGSYHVLSYYYPKYCPECGRPLTENDSAITEGY